MNEMLFFVRGQNVEKRQISTQKKVYDECVVFVDFSFTYFVDGVDRQQNIFVWIVAKKR